MQSGTLELASRRWSWQILASRGRTEPATAGVRESSTGDAEPEPRTEEPAGRLELEDLQDPRIRMSRSLPAGVEVESEAEARQLAMSPDERTVVDEAGDVWTLTPLERPEATARNDEDFDRPPRKVRYAREGEPEQIGRLPVDRTLGEASMEELLDVVGD